MAIIVNRNVTSGEMPIKIPDGTVTTTKLADGAVTDAKIDWSTVGFYNYSTTETQVGTWIDGSPLYRQTVNFGTLPNATESRLAHGITNIDRIVKVVGYAYRTSDTTFFPIPFASTIGSEYNILITTSPTEIVIGTGVDRSNITECYVTLYYTKST